MLSFVTRLTVALAILLLPILSIAAMAQDAPRSTSVSAGGLYDALSPVIATTLSVVITAVLGWIAALVHRWTGIKIEAVHREALHSAAMSGVSAALTRFRKSAADVRIETGSAVIADAVEWVQRSVPDAIKALGVTDENITKLVMSKLSMLAEAPSAPVTPQGNRA